MVGGMDTAAALGKFLEHARLPQYEPKPAGKWVEAPSLRCLPATDEAKRLWQGEKDEVAAVVRTAPQPALCEIACAPACPPRVPSR